MNISEKLAKRKVWKKKVLIFKKVRYYHYLQSFEQARKMYQKLNKLSYAEIKKYVWEMKS